MKNKWAFRTAVAVALTGLLALLACTGMTTEDIQGLLQAVEGKEVVVRQDNGNTIRITVEDPQAASAASQLVGNEVRLRVNIVRNNVRKLEEVRRLGENSKSTGVIQSIGQESWTIGGQTFKVNANTRLDGGLATGVTARVEFVTLADGARLATEIETDEDRDDFKGNVQTTGADAWVIGGQTFKISPATRIDPGLSAGSPVRVQFTIQPDGSLLATRIENERAQDRLSGVVQSISTNSWVVGGRTFKVNTATRLDDGLMVGVKARVEFVTLADAASLATEIQTDEAEERFSGVIQSMGADSWVIGGRTFKVSPAARLDRELVTGMKARVRFIAMTDGTMLATRIQQDRQGTSREGDFNGKVESRSASAWVIGGKTFKISAVTRIESGLAVGEDVRVRFVSLADGSMLASRIDPERGRAGDRGREAAPGQQDDRGRGNDRGRGGPEQGKEPEQRGRETATPGKGR
ncbi:MAG: hypothetical protein HY673_11170 [Chloroflexi bacterium]|nr:hypothetical protein [Chloroflexota bacterium]